MSWILQGVALALAVALTACTTMETGGTSGAPKPGPTPAEPRLSFPIVADLPYNRDQQFGFRLISKAIADGSFPFVVHIGDYKGGGMPCTDEIDDAFKAWLGSFPDTPVFYTPGDNEWTDCDRDFQDRGPSVPEQERLIKIRAQMFDAPPATPADWATQRQDGLPENAIWSADGILFAMIHVVGTNNGRNQIRLGDVEAALADVAARDAANLAWLDAAFDRAAREQSDAVILLQHGDPLDSGHDAPCSDENRQECDGFAAYRERMRALARGYGGPVLLVHGDTAPYCLDTDFGGENTPRFWRLNTGGDFVLIDAVRLTVAPDDADTPFTAESLLHRIRPATGC